MQTSNTYHSTVTLAFAPAGKLAAKQSAATLRFHLLRALAHRWDMIAVAFLMVSSGAYGVYALSHLSHL